MNTSLKNNFLNKILYLTNFHKKQCAIYKKLLNKLNFKISKKTKLNDIPFLPTRLFKKFDLLSIKKDKIVKILTSSGTTNQGHSKIFLDKKNAENQIIALKNIMSPILGKERLPMLIVDKNPKYFERGKFSARIAAIIGFSIFGKNYFYLLDNDGNIDYVGLKNFLEQNNKNKILIFGFTSLIFKILIKKIDFQKFKIDFSNSILLHGGGWKKLEKKKISNSKFKHELLKKFKISKIYNYYGTIEQAGSIFIECENCGGFRTTKYSDILIRDDKFNILEVNQKGIVQILSTLPTSYPGHSILTEDEGVIRHDNSCNKNFNGKCFIINGRLKKAELRGCSDVGSA